MPKYQLLILPRRHLSPAPTFLSSQYHRHNPTIFIHITKTFNSLQDEPQYWLGYHQNPHHTNDPRGTGAIELRPRTPTKNRFRRARCCSSFYSTNFSRAFPSPASTLSGFDSEKVARDYGDVLSPHPYKRVQDRSFGRKVKNFFRGRGVFEWWGVSG